ncbi:hypothetical protein C2E25_11155 [Geothermobacter hydrogeniphilus]|uniref:Uncharacterized protein n=1 Tax=Geothermobacter hydrogeniphilus TaxID=1969733 RepID=A0A2K2H8V9_9BACT|nr:hypothetical protein [Geothermobacter hydrogeniphilus]PNU19745.1 hypothetical protein C2E25_11155 [Geothermobacter hydrogeniphilus]
MARFPTGRTAFVVIHGIGEQNPFDTLDGFGRGLLELFDRQGINYRLAHKLKRHPEEGWTESFLHISPKNRGKSAIDIHEVYWAYLTEEQITAAEIRQWLEDTLAGVKTFFDENQQLIREYEQADQVEQLQKLNKKLRWGARLYPPVSAALQLLDPLSRLTGGWGEVALKWLGDKASPYLTGYLGDVAIYTTTDRKSKFFNLRQQILRDSLAMLRAVLADEEVERVILCGHSLGSVIAYDTLNRLQIEASLPEAEELPLDKIKGLITFGSPLDKIAFFFRQHAGKEQWLRGQILGQLHSFKSKPLCFNDPPVTFDDPVKHVFADLPWVNYWDRQDPVSGRLNLYRIDPEDNVELKLGKPWGLAHVAYWEHVPMYADFAGRFLGLQATAS